MPHPWARTGPRGFAPSRSIHSRGVRILIFHGYLLRGTGSNVYNAELAEALVRLGHEVHLLCQEAHPERLGFVDSVGSWEGGRLEVQDVRRPRTPAAARSTGPTSAACCPSTCTTTTRASRCGPSTA